MRMGEEHSSFTAPSGVVVTARRRLCRAAGPGARPHAPRPRPEADAPSSLRMRTRSQTNAPGDKLRQASDRGLVVVGDTADQLGSEAQPVMIAGPHVATLASRNRADSPFGRSSGWHPGRRHLPERHRTPPSIPETVPARRGHVLLLDRRPEPRSDYAVLCPLTGRVGAPASPHSCSRRARSAWVDHPGDVPTGRSASGQTHRYADIVDLYK